MTRFVELKLFFDPNIWSVEEVDEIIQSDVESGNLPEGFVGYVLK